MPLINNNHHFIANHEHDDNFYYKSLATTNLICDSIIESLFTSLPCSIVYSQHVSYFYHKILNVIMFQTCS